MFFTISTAKREGASPNVIRSARESNSFPIEELTLSNLATNPSKKSNIAPRIINNDAVTNGIFTAS